MEKRIMQGMCFTGG